MLQSVSKEKETRTAEVLLLSLRPRQLMLGKLVGLGLVALFQIIIWFGGGMLFLDRGKDLLGALSTFTLPPGFIGWVLAYFCLGFAAYASVLAAVGVLAPTAREGAQFTFFVMLPLMIPLWMNSVFAQNPNGDVATFLSLFPPTAPLSMVTRLAAGGVPSWQPAVGLAGLAVMTYLFVLLSARLFRADTLLSSESLSWQRIVRELRRIGR
jgi:ABC-2 type transport system permease protein